MGYIMIGLAVVLFLVYLQHKGFEKNVIRGVAWFGLNVLLILLLVVPSAKLINIKSTNLNLVTVAIGRNSLPIYLWHVAPLFLFKGFDLHQTQPLIYYFFSTLVIILITWFILKFESLNKMTDRLIYGC